MKLPELHDTIIISEKNMNDLSTINAKLLKKLQDMKTRTSITDREISFKTIPTIMPWGYIDSYPTLLRIYKEGIIVIKKDKQSLHIKWTVRVENLLLIALFSSLIFGLIARFPLSLEIVQAIFASFGFFLVFVVLGIEFIKYKMTELIESCVYRDSNSRHP